jgi:hypothetical protein
MVPNGRALRPKSTVTEGLALPIFPLQPLSLGMSESF